MRVRIYLLEGDIDFKGRIIPSLAELNNLNFDFVSKKYFIHIGFEAPNNSEVAKALEKLPSGFYCDVGFSLAKPGEKWKFSELLNASSDGLLVHYIYESSCRNHEITSEQILQVEAIISKSDSPEDNEGNSIPDEVLSKFEWSNRTSNCFKNNQITLLSELVKYSESDLLSIPNFGRKSLYEVKDFLLNRALKLGQNQKFSDIIADDDTPANPTNFRSSGNFFKDIIAVIQQQKNDRDIDVLFDRSGVTSFLTLEEIGKKYSITRERVRQIEKKALSKIFFRTPNTFTYWYNRITEIMHNSAIPIQIDELQKLHTDFSHDQPLKHLIEFVLSSVQKFQKDKIAVVYVIKYLDAEYLSFLNIEDLSALKNSIRNELKSSEGCLLDDIKERAQLPVATEGKIFFELIWQELLSEFSLSKDDSNNVILEKFIGNKLSNQLLLELEKHVQKSKRSFKTSELLQFLTSLDGSLNPRTVINLLDSSEKIALVGHGIWSDLEQINMNLIVRNKIIWTADQLIKKSKSESFHSREVYDRLKNQLPAEFNEFYVTVILKRFGSYKYHGRNAFAGLGSELEGRVLLHDVFEKVLVEAGKPLHRNELLKAARKYRSVSDTFMIQIKPPIINIGKSVYALDYWDVKPESVDVPQITMRTEPAIHQHHIHEDKNIQLNNAEWTVKRISLLNKLWTNGVSISAIAKELGLSRNAVAGKAHRLKLPKRNRVYEQSNAWDEEKQERLIKLRKYGLSAARISEIIEVSEDLIRKKIELL